MTISVNGEELTDSEAQRLVNMLYHDAKQFAGEFYDMSRSKKFRANWPNQYDFAETEFRNFIAAVRLMYSQRLGDPKTPPEDARKMHLAIVLYDMAGHGKEKDIRLQIAPDSEQFEGAKRTNSKIVEKFGTTRNFRAALMASSAGSRIH